VSLKSQSPADDPPPVAIILLPALLGALIWLCAIISRLPT
jgi:hypothetical protein